MTFYQAQQCFDDAIPQLDPADDPVMWDLLNGLSAMAQALASLQGEVEQLRQALQRLAR